MKCTNCGSINLIEPARVVSYGGTVAIGIDADPDALLVKETTISSIAAGVCSECGHIELFAEELPELKAAFRKAQSRIDDRP